MLDMQIPLPEDVTKNLQNAKSFIDNAVDRVNQNVQQTKSTVLESTSQSVETLNQATERAKDTITEAASSTLGNVTEKSGQLLNSITNATNTLKDSLQTTIEKIDSLNQTLSDGIQASINSSLNGWIDQHPQLVWLINHPLQSLGILLLGLFLFSGLLGAISRITEKFWLFILTYPFKIFSNSWLLISKSLQKDDDNQKTEIQKRVTEILSRLESIRQEQTSLSQELESLLK
jgi:phage-related protein